MTYITYLTIYDGDKMPTFYIGSTSLNNYNKGYRGSVASKKYKEIWKLELKEHPELFDTIILTEHSTRKEALDQELSFHIQKNVVRNPDFINLSLACNKGYWGFNNHSKHMTSEEKAQRADKVKKTWENLTIEERSKRKIIWSEAQINQTPEKRFISSIKQSETWKRKTPEEKAHRLKKLRATLANQTPEEKAHRSLHHSEAMKKRTPELITFNINKMQEARKNMTQEKRAEYRRKLSEAQRGKQTGEDNHNYNKKWWNNGVDSVMSIEQPYGFIPGRLSPHSIEAVENIRKHISKTRWWNNSIKNVRTIERPEGYVPGRIMRSRNEQT